MNYFLPLFLLSSSLLIIASCKKDDSVHANNPAASSLVRRMTVYDLEDDTVMYEFSYRADSTVETLWISANGSPADARVFEHTPSRITSRFGGNIFDTAWLDAQARVVQWDSWAAGIKGTERRFYYDASGQLAMTVRMQYATAFVDTVWHTWSGGNIVSEYGNNYFVAVSYTYDASKPFMRGEPRHLAALRTFGRNSTASMNLLQSIAEPTETRQGSYQYDAEGRIVQSEFIRSANIRPTKTVIEYY